MTDVAADAFAAHRGTIPTVLRSHPRDAAGRLSLASQRYLLLLRFSVVNGAGFALLAAAWAEGLIDPIIAADTTRLCLLIFLVFLAGLGLSADRIRRISREMNLAKEYDPALPSRAARYLAEVQGRDSGARAIAASALKFKLSARVGTVRHISSALVVLGLIGTVIGFIMALSGVDPENAGDVAAITPMVSKLIEGMAVALYTTLVGGVLNIWLNINAAMLAGATVNLITEIVALGERHAVA
ncbi:MotA/TolQ/ExbB proton channel family protein [Azospirillum halopraeferens]|uniref:MotA/TolQ/ExbB proton channel family protein n=1 Tax=Azospirillum halopraeferens TaxID=34010 RepID=UPI000409D18D|nr:MotA/TolQ/ExbB proton channel family protein [Azospirillum halopraeferens]